MKKAQVAIEYIALMGFLILALLMVAPWAVYYISEKVTDFKAENAVNTLQNDLNKVYGLGKCSETLTYVEIPGGVTNYSIRGQDFSIRMGNRDVVGITKAPLVGYIPIIEGGYTIRVRYACSQQLVLGDALTMIPDEVNGDISNTTNPLILWINVTNNLNENVSGIVMNTTGLLSGRVKFTPSAFNLTSKSTQQVLVNITVDSSVNGYSLTYLTAKAGKGFDNIPAMFNVYV
jgi:hypothetical protein